MTRLTADIERARALHHQRGESDALPAGIIGLVASLGIVWWLFADRAAPELFLGWFIYMVALVVAMVVGLAVFLIWRPNDDIYLDWFGPLGRWLVFGVTVGVAASVWVLMPAADNRLQMVMVVIYMWFVMTQVMVHGERFSLLTTAAIVGVLGSLILYILTNQMAYSSVLAIVLTLVAMTMAALQKVFRSSMREAIDARIISEETAHARDQALAAVVVERDTKARFLEAASHDLRQPLQAARMFLDQAERSPLASQRDTAIERLHWTLDATDRSLTQILEFLRLDGGDVRADLRSFCIGPLLLDAAAMAQPASASGPAINVVPTSCKVIADPDLVSRALSNLIGNALRHARCDRIVIGARAGGNRVRMWVIDNGIGTVPEDRARIFDDYVQGSDHGDTQRGGFGLGLASVRRLAELMGGSAGLDERWTCGSAFWLELPRGDD